MVKATYEGAKTSIRMAYGKTKEFAIQVGIHQGSALTPFLFIVVMDTLVNEIKSAIPWELVFADDIALMAETGEGVEMLESIGESRIKDECKEIRSFGRRERRRG